MEFLLPVKKIETYFGIVDSLLIVFFDRFKNVERCSFIVAEKRLVVVSCCLDRTRGSDVLYRIFL